MYAVEGLVATSAQMIAPALLKNHILLDRYQMAEHFQSGLNHTRARVGIMFLSSSAKDLAPFDTLLCGRVAM